MIAYISGSNGFVGSNLRSELLMDPRIQLIKEEGRLPYVVPWGKADIVYHLASNTDTLFDNDVKMFQNNILGFLKIIEYCKYSGAKLIWASSSAIYGNNDGPLNAYAHSKLVMEEIAGYFSKQIPIVGLRFFNVFGPGEIQKGKMASMITQWAVQIKKGYKPRVFRESSDLIKRDHVYVKDVVNALRKAETTPTGIYDVGSGQPYPWKEVLNLVQKSLKTNQKIEWIPNKNPETYQTFTKAKLDWGFQPSYSLEEGIKDYLCKYF